MAHDYRENLILALETLRAHKMRSFLAILGVMIGVGVIIVVAALLGGFDQSVRDAIISFGADTAFISQYEQGPRTGRMTAEERARKPLSLADGEALLESCPAVKNVAISLFQNEKPHNVRYHDNEVTGTDFRGTFPAFLQVYANAALKKGRFFTEAENLHREKVVVLGENAAAALFPGIEPLDKEI